MRRANTTKEEAAEKTVLADKHLGIIVSKCIHFYRAVPPWAQHYYDLEDMIGEVVVHIVKNSGQYDSNIAKEVTFVGNVAENQCKSILSRFYTARETGGLTEEGNPKIEQKALTPLLELHIPDDPDVPVYNEIQFQISVDAVEAVIEFGSDALLDLIERIFSRTIPQNWKADPKLVDEFRTLARKHHASVDDFLFVYQYA